MSQQEAELREAIRAGDAERVRALLLSEPELLDPAARTQSWKPMDTLLHEAGSGEVAALLIDAGQPVDARGWMELTALHQASWHGRADVVHVLLERGADPNDRHARGLSPLSVAATPAIAGMLLARGADPGYREELDTTPLHRAAMEARPAVAEELCAAGAPIDARNAWGQTPLHHAATARDANATRILLDAGADVSVVDDAGNTPLHLGAARAATEVVRRLLEHGADPTISNIRGDIPFDVLGWSDPESADLGTGEVGWESLPTPRVPYREARSSKARRELATLLTATATGSGAA